MAPDVTVKAAEEIQKRDLIGKPSVRLPKLAGSAPEGSPRYRQAQTMLLAEGVLTDGIVTRTRSGHFVDESGVLFDVVNPTAGGAAPTAAQIAADVVHRLKQPAPSGSKASGQRKVIIDLSGITNPREREAVLKLLASDPEAEGLHSNIFVHDRQTRQIAQFDPDNPLGNPE
jgi:hypothetical protein